MKTLSQERLNAELFSVTLFIVTFTKFSVTLAKFVVGVTLSRDCE